MKTFSQKWDRSVSWTVIRKTLYDSRLSSVIKYTLSLPLGWTEPTTNQGSNLTIKLVNGGSIIGRKGNVSSIRRVT